MSNSSNQKSEGGKAGPRQGGTSTSTTSSGIMGPNFDNLHLQKRSTDPESVARRNSLAEQKPQGMFGKMWSNFVGGPTGGNPPEQK